MTRSNLLFGRMTTGDRNTDIGLGVLRVVAGLALAFLHGIGKMPPADWLVGRAGDMGFPMPTLFAWLAALAELAGGVMLALGVLTRPVAVFVTIHFVIVVLLAHAGDPIADRELPILFLSIATLFALAGPGRYSLDALIRGRSAP